MENIPFDRGGSIAEKLVASGHEVKGLARSREQAQLLKTRGMDSVTGTLDDPEILTNAAQSADAVINAASADHPGSVVTLVTALERSGKLLIHTAGSDCGYGTWVREGASCRRSMARSSSVIGGLVVGFDRRRGAGCHPDLL